MPRFRWELTRLLHNRDFRTFRSKERMKTARALCWARPAAFTITVTLLWIYSAPRQRFIISRTATKICRFFRRPSHKSDCPAHGKRHRELLGRWPAGLFAFITVVPRTVCEACPWSWSVHQGGIYAGKGLESAKDKIRCGDCRLGIRRRNHGGENFRCAR